MTNLLDGRASEFASEIERLLTRVLPGTHAVRSREHASGQRYLVEPPVQESGVPGKIPLLVGGEPLAQLVFSCQLSHDHSGRYLKAERAEFRVLSNLDKEPLARLEYQANMHTAPIAHWQVHGERGALTHLMTRANTLRPKAVPRPAVMSSIHSPSEESAFVRVSRTSSSSWSASWVSMRVMGGRRLSLPAVQNGGGSSFARRCATARMQPSTNSAHWAIASTAPHAMSAAPLELTSISGDHTLAAIV